MSHERGRSDPLPSPQEVAALLRLSAGVPSGGDDGEGRDSCHWWLGWSLALPLGEALELRPEHVEPDRLALPVTGATLPLTPEASETVGRVVRSAQGPERAFQAVFARFRRAARRVRPEGFSWLALRRAGLRHRLESEGWRSALLLARTVGVNLDSVVTGALASLVPRGLAVPSTTVTLRGATLDGVRGAPETPMLRERLNPPPEIADAIEAAARAVGLDEDILFAVAYTESAFDPEAVSRAGAKGLFQFMDPTWDEWGRGSPFDAEAAALAGARYLRSLLTRFNGDLGATLAAYNWGMGNLQRRTSWPQAWWQERLPRETKLYLTRIGKLLGRNLRFFEGGGPAPGGGGPAAAALAALGVLVGALAAAFVR